MFRRLCGISLVVALVGFACGCGDNKPSGPTTPLPPSREVNQKNDKGKMVVDELPR